MTRGRKGVARIAVGGVLLAGITAGLGAKSVNARALESSNAPALTDATDVVNKLTDVQLKGRGFSVHHPASIVTLAGGGKKYVYDFNGRHTEFAVPPPNFNPLTASDSTLSLYNLPPRPSGPALAGWTSLMQHLKHVVPTTRMIEAPAAAGSNNSVSHKNLPGDSTHAGYVDTAGSGLFYEVESMTYNEPTWTNACNAPSWAGVIYPGLQGSGLVTQDGTETQVVNGQTLLNHAIWYETAGSNAQTSPDPSPIIGPFTIPTGDVTEAFVYDYPGTRNITYIVEDVTNGNSWVAGETNLVPTPTVATWILERHGDLGKPNSGVVSFHNDWWVDNKGNSGYVGISDASPPSAAGQILDQPMVDLTKTAPGNQIATPGGTYDYGGNSQSSFDITWNNCN